MQYVSPYGSPIAERTSSTDSTSVLKAWDVATVAALKAIETIDGTALTASTRPRCMTVAQGREERVRVASMAGRIFAWHPTSTVTADDQLVIIPDDRNMAVDTDLAASLAGRWLAVPGQIVNLALPFTYATADAVTLYTLPTGAAFKVEDLYWEITTGCSGGSSSAIGVSTTKTSPTNWSSKGDLLGGSGGDVAATLVAGARIVGTIGTDMDTIAKVRGAIWEAAELFRFDRITSAFTAGAGNVHVYGILLANAGA
jgi:hypothetical protein